MNRLGLRSQLLIGLLVAILGFALAVQLRTTRDSSRFASARQEDLVRILDDLTARGDRLRQQIDELQATKDRLTGGAGQTAAALADTRRRLDALRILAGTAPATGPGIELTIDDPKRSVASDVLLDAMQELRDAGAEVIQVGPVRLVAGSAFTDRGSAVLADGHVLAAPYRFLAIGDPHTLGDAMTIPGGVIDNVNSRAGAVAHVTERPRLAITALRPLSTPRYARPAASQDSG